MAIFVNLQHPGLKVAKKPLIELVQRILIQEGKQGVFSITLTEDRLIRRLNRIYRCRDQFTDVLAFPIGVTGECLWGDIYINLDAAQRQALAYGHSFVFEVCLLVTHSVLHLCGFDDSTPEEQKAMEDRAYKYLT
jgi:probable rRNA maturation factor